ncbi:MAG: hypothetical protein ABIR24_07775 [Verrucomicrobiota bacterium]
MSKPLQIKGASETLRARLEESAQTNFRNLEQEALARLERSFEMEDALTHERDQKWIDEAMSSPVKPGGVRQLREIAQKVLAKK